MTQLLGERGLAAGAHRRRGRAATPARAAGARAGLLARRLGGRADERCLSRSGIRCRGLRAAARALTRRQQDRRLARRADCRLAGRCRGPAAAAGCLSRSVLHGQGRDPETARRARPRPRPCPTSRTCCAPRPSGWPRCSIASPARRWSSSRWRCCGSASTSPAATPRAKRRRAALDYDDLIVATRRLLESAESAAWVLYKLDGGIDHVLVDEAQDTNPDQWEVIRRLTEEFFAGQGAVERDTHDLRRRRHQAVDLRLPARRPAQARGDARMVRRAQPHGRASASCRSTSMSPSARRRPCSMRSTGCSARTRRRAASPSRAT